MLDVQATALRALVIARASPSEIRAAIAGIAPRDRDPCVDLALDLELPPDDARLPQSCVPYLPCDVEMLLAVADHVTAADVFVDVGAGIGRAAALVTLLTGASAIGLEIQPALIDRARELATRLALPIEMFEGDVAELTAPLAAGTVFFLYCPFSGRRLEAFLDALEPIARARPIRICTVDLPLPPRSWLARLHDSTRLSIYGTVS